MVSPQKRTKKYKFRKTSTETKRAYFKGKPKKKKCAITGNILSGVPFEGKGKVSKHSKTQKRPSAPFGGILSGEAREAVFVEMGKVVAGVKSIDDVDTKYRGYVKQALKRAEVQ